jgi:hypothetical protein
MYKIGKDENLSLGRVYAIRQYFIADATISG